jgi:hypothetical protein
MTLTVLWVCDTCGASGEIEVEVSCTNLAALTIEGALEAMEQAIRLCTPPPPGAARGSTTVLGFPTIRCLNKLPLRSIGTAPLKWTATLQQLAPS